MRLASISSVGTFALLLLLSLGLFAQQPSLSRQAQAAYDKGAYADAAPLFLLAAQVESSSAPTHLYNAGCCYALLDKTELAFHSLSAAVKKGWRNRTQTVNDPDLESLHGDTRWNDLLGLISSGGGLESNRDAMVNDLNNLAAQAYQYRIRPESMGGGQGSYVGYRIPTKMMMSENASYEVLSAINNLVHFRATSAKSFGTIEVSVDGDGRLVQWKYNGKFGAPEQKSDRPTSVGSNRDALINHMNNIAAFAYQYRIRPSGMNGGNGAYNGLKLIDQLASTEDGTFGITVMGDVAVQIQARSKIYNATITATLDGKGRLGGWKYTGDFR